MSKSETHMLVRKADQVKVVIGSILKGRDDDQHYKLSSWEVPRHAGSSGRVYVFPCDPQGNMEKGIFSQGLFPHVFDLEIVQIGNDLAHRVHRIDIENVLDEGRLQVQRSNGVWVNMRRNGKTKLWKTRPTEFKIPIKIGLREYGYIGDYLIADDGYATHEFRRRPD